MVLSVGLQGGWGCILPADFLSGQRRARHIGSAFSLWNPVRISPRTILKPDSRLEHRLLLHHFGQVLVAADSAQAHLPKGDEPPYAFAASTSPFWIFSRQRAGPIWWMALPLLSTATVTGMS